VCTIVCAEASSARAVLESQVSEIVRAVLQVCVCECMCECVCGGQQCSSSAGEPSVRERASGAAGVRV